MRCVVLLEVMVKAQHVPRVFNDFFTLPQAKKPDPNSETSPLASAVIELSVYVFRCIQCATILYLHHVLDSLRLFECILENVSRFCGMGEDGRMTRKKRCFDVGFFVLMTCLARLHGWFGALRARFCCFAKENAETARHKK